MTERLGWDGAPKDLRSLADGFGDGTYGGNVGHRADDVEEANRMRIPPETIRSLVGLHAHRVSRTSAVGLNGKTGTVGRAAAGDQVNLSEEAAMLSTLKQGVKAMPEVDARRVQEVRQELASGRFEVEPYRVAEGVILELTGAW